MVEVAVWVPQVALGGSVTIRVAKGASRRTVRSPRPVAAAVQRRRRCIQGAAGLLVLVSCSGVGDNWAVAVDVPTAAMAVRHSVQPVVMVVLLGPVVAW